MSLTKVLKYISFLLLFSCNKKDIVIDDVSVVTEGSKTTTSVNGNQVLFRGSLLSPVTFEVEDHGFYWFTSPANSGQGGIGQTSIIDDDKISLGTIQSPRSFEAVKSSNTADGTMLSYVAYAKLYNQSEEIFGDTVTISF